MSKKHVINLKRLFDNKGNSLVIDQEIDLSPQKILDKQVFKIPAQIKGVITAKAGLVWIDYQIHAKLTASCDRCLEDVNLTFENSFTHDLVEWIDDEENLDDYVFCEDGILDLYELSVSDIFLNIDSKFLCQKNCMGLCVVCGKNLNNETCDCQKKEIDPRLAVLKKLL